MEEYENNPLTPEEQPSVEQLQQEVTAEEETVTAVGETPAQQPEEAPGYTAPVHTEAPYHNAGIGRKESPFANSPYVTQFEPAQQAQAPVKPKKAKKPGNKKFLRCAVAVIAVIALIASGCGITAACVNHYWENRNATMVEGFNSKIDALQKQIDSNGMNNAIVGNSVSNTEGMTPAQVYARNVGAVVAVSNHSTSTNIYGQISRTASAGSGFIVSEDGYVVTNYHVVMGATSLAVITSDSTEYEAELVGYDSTNDLAVLKIDATGLQCVTLGNSDDLIIGDQVVAIGNPLGELTSTLTAGYISAKDRDVTTEGTAINMLQTDAAINSGNSGGPLFNMNGEVVGITTAKYSGTSSSGATIESIGFAIPIDDVVGMIQDLTQYGYVTGAYLGVMVSDMDAEAADIYGLPMGAYVQETTDGYCAKAAGVQAKDIIVDLGGYEVESVNDLTRALRHFKAGDKTTITVYRSGSGNEITMDITLDEKPVETQTAPAQTEQMPSEGSFDEWYSYLEPFFGHGND